MTSREFCYWLQGFFEIDGEKPGDGHVISPNQAAVIKRHLAMVFKHEIDPSYGDQKKQDVLNAIHGVGPKPDALMRC